MTADSEVRGSQKQTRTNQLEVVDTRVFAAAPGGGNPCPVVPFADQLSDSEMQAVARKFGLDTAFILRPRSKSSDIRLRYFVPQHEMGVSGHATIAAIAVARSRNMLQSDHARVETITGTFEIDSIKRNEDTVITLEQNQPTFRPNVDPEIVARVLKIDRKQIAPDRSPVQSVSVSRAKLIVPLEDSKVLNALAPAYEALWDLCDTLQVTGLYPFTRHTDKAKADVEARQFPLRAGFPEDAATGVAAAALGAYLATHDSRCQAGRHVFRVAQGYAMGAPSLIEAIAECAGGTITRTAIRGVACIVGHERIAL